MFLTAVEWSVWSALSLKAVIASTLMLITVLFDGCSYTVCGYIVERSVHCSWPLNGQARLRLKLDKSLDASSTSLLHQHGATGGWGADPEPY